MWSHKTGGFLTQVNYSGRKCAFGDLKEQSLNTGGLKDMFDYASIDHLYNMVDFSSHKRNARSILTLR